MYGDLTSSIHTANTFHCFVIVKGMHVFVFEDHMLDWHSCQICYPLEIKLLLLFSKKVFRTNHNDLLRLAFRSVAKGAEI